MTVTASHGSPLLEAREVTMRFGQTVALSGVSFSVQTGEVHCLLGDNGAGKSTLVKILSGVCRPSSGRILINSAPTAFSDPREARMHGIATVFQNPQAVPLMSVARNFFLGAEPTKGRGLGRHLDLATAEQVALAELRSIGLTRISGAAQLAGTLSGGELQGLAIARALYFGARVLILDEPTSALGVRESGTVLRLVESARGRGVGVVVITHSAHHALRIGDRFTVLSHGAVRAQFARGERTQEDVIGLMAGLDEFEGLNETAISGARAWA